MPWWGSNRPKLMESAEFSIIEDITITPHEIGRGSYGTVYAALYDGKPCVAKEMHPYLSHYKSGQNVSTPLEVFVKEINTLSALKHPSIVQFLGVYFSDKSHVPILVMERMWKNLFDLIEEQQPNQLPLLIKTHIIYDVACGLQYLHGQKKPVVHRDLNANNVLLTKNLEAKIADLGQAKALERLDGQRLSTAPGNVAHMAPETLKHRPTYDAKLDIFSFGCTVLHLVTGRFPSPSEQFVAVDNDSFIKVSEIDRRKEYINTICSSNSSLHKIVLQCLEDTPAKRPDMSFICTHIKRYCEELEKESVDLAQQYKQDKLTLIRLFQSHVIRLERNKEKIDELNRELCCSRESNFKKEEYIKTIEFQMQDIKCKLELGNLSTDQKMISLQNELNNKDEIIKELNTATASRMNRLKEDLLTKHNEVEVANTKCATLQKTIHKLQDKHEQEISVAKSEFMQLQDKFDIEKQTLLKECANLKDDLRKASDATLASQKECKKLVAAKKCLLDENSQLKQEASELKVKTDESQKKEMLPQEDLKQLSSEPSYQPQQANQSILLEKLTKENTSLLKKITETQEEVDGLESTNKKLQKTLNETYEKLMTREKLCQETDQKLTDDKIEYAKGISSLQQQVNHISSELAAERKTNLTVKKILVEKIQSYKHNFQSQLAEFLALQHALKSMMDSEINMIQNKIKQKHKNYYTDKNEEMKTAIKKFNRQSSQEKAQLHSTIEYLETQIEHCEAEMNVRLKSMSKSIELAGELSDAYQRHDDYRRKAHDSMSRGLPLRPPPDPRKWSHSKGAYRVPPHFKKSASRFKEDESDDGSSDISLRTDSKMTHSKTLSYHMQGQIPTDDSPSALTSQDEENDNLGPSSKNEK